MLRGSRCPLRVVKIGGRVQSDPSLPSVIAAAVNAGGHLCVVHGGGDEVSDVQRRLGLVPAFLGGRRVTSDADLDVVRMVLSGTANKRIVAQLLGVGIRAAGISGEDGWMLRARVTDPRMGRVGGDIVADPAIVVALLSAGFTPVISPVARDIAAPDGAGLNVNGDDAAGALARALGAQELVLVADVAGVLDGSTVLPTLDEGGVQSLIERGVATGGMLAKLDAARRALDSGVPAVRIAGISGIVERGAGTRIIKSSAPAH